MVFIFTIASVFFMTLGIATEVDREKTLDEFEKRVVEEAMEHNERELDRAERYFEEE